VLCKPRQLGDLPHARLDDNQSKPIELDDSINVLSVSEEEVNYLLTLEFFTPPY